jgi:hypothetical protein
MLLCTTLYMTAFLAKLRIGGSTMHTALLEYSIGIFNSLSYHRANSNDCKGSIPSARFPLLDCSTQVNDLMILRLSFRSNEHTQVHSCGALANACLGGAPTCPCPCPDTPGFRVLLPNQILPSSSLLVRPFHFFVPF